MRDEVPDEHNAAFSLAMFAFTATRTYRDTEIRSWLEEARFGAVEHIALPASSVSLVVATRM